MNLSVTLKEEFKVLWRLTPKNKQFEDQENKISKQQGFLAMLNRFLTAWLEDIRRNYTSISTT